MQAIRQKSNVGGCRIGTFYFPLEQHSGICVGGKKARKISGLGSHATLFQKGLLQTHVTFICLEEVIKDYTEESVPFYQVR